MPPRKTTNACATVPRASKAFNAAGQAFRAANIPFRETVAEKAGRELFDIRHLALGKLAPEIEGQDQNGQPLKLSDYRGEVVLIYFWQQY